MNRRDEISEILLFGLSYKTAPLEIREKLTFDKITLSEFHKRAKEHGIDEMVYLATCNRVEIYFTARAVHRSIEKLVGLLEEYTGLSGEALLRYIYVKYSRDVVMHLLTVASSIDSMIIGENEILGQIKYAYRDSVLHRSSGILLNRLFHQAFNTAKKVRTRTGISQNHLSVAYIAVEQSRKLYGNDLTNRSALLVGAGEMGELILKYLTKNNIRDITIANRSLQNAERIAGIMNRQARVMQLSDIAKAAEKVDIIITSVICNNYLLTHAMIDSISKKRNGRNLLIIDIAVPRNVDPRVAAIQGVKLYNIDDLRSLANENLKNRLREIDLVMQIIQSDTNELIEWYEGLEIVPMIVKIHEGFDGIREQEVQKYRRRQLKNLPEEDFEVINDLTKQIISKILHNPIMTIKKNKALKKNGYHDREAVKEKIAMLEELFSR